MTNYRRVTYGDRCQIQAYLQVPLSVKEISQKLGLHRSTVFREIFRNRQAGRYCAEGAQALARRRFKRCRRKYRIRGEVEAQILRFLARDWSPEQVAGRFFQEHIPQVSHSTIYRFIRRHYRRRLKRLLRTYDRRGGGRSLHQKRHALGKLSISDRPQIVNLRQRFGDWERDTFYAQHRKQVLVCTDRKSRYTKLKKLRHINREYVARQTQRLLDQTFKKVWTMTNDNGAEFRKPLDLNIPTYYCTPYKPQQRGTVENTIGLLRQYIKRSTNLDTLSHQDLRHIEDKLNLRPRKCLDYKTPFEVFYETSVALAM